MREAALGESDEKELTQTGDDDEQPGKPDGGAQDPPHGDRPARLRAEAHRACGRRSRSSCTGGDLRDEAQHVAVANAGLLERLVIADLATGLLVMELI